MGWGWGLDGTATTSKSPPIFDTFGSSVVCVARMKSQIFRMQMKPLLASHFRDCSQTPGTARLSDQTATRIKASPSTKPEQENQVLLGYTMRFFFLLFFFISSDIAPLALRAAVLLLHTSGRHDFRPDLRGGLRGRTAGPKIGSPVKAF